MRHRRSRSHRRRVSRSRSTPRPTPQRRDGPSCRSRRSASPAAPPGRASWTRDGPAAPSSSPLLDPEPEGRHLVGRDDAVLEEQRADAFHAVLEAPELLAAGGEALEYAEGLLQELVAHRRHRCHDGIGLGALELLAMRGLLENLPGLERPDGFGHKISVSYFLPAPAKAQKSAPARTTPPRT